MTLNNYIDHTLLKPTATVLEIRNLCDEAKKFNFFSVCVNSAYVKLAKAELNKSDVNICSVIGFPLGAMTTKAKAKEAKIALKNGADFIKTSTGFGTGGATVPHIKLIKSVTNGTNVKIKASGGIKDAKTALNYINLGVERLGTSSGIAIVTGKTNSTSNY